MATVIQFKRGTTSNLYQVNPVLAKGEPCFDYEQGKLKIGDGIHNYNDLPDIEGFSYDKVFSGKVELKNLTASENDIQPGRYLVKANTTFFIDGVFEQAFIDHDTFIDIKTTFTGEVNTIRGYFPYEDMEILAVWRVNVTEFYYGPCLDPKKQSDWNETNKNKITYIKNKPAIPVVEQIYSPTSTNAQSGVAIKPIADKAMAHIQDFAADDDGVHGIKFTPDHKVKIKDEHEVWTTVINPYKTYTAIIDEEESDPDLAVSYADDAKDMEAKSEKWLETDIFKDIRPCVFRDGEVQCYLDPNNYTQQIKNTEPLFYADEDIDLNKNMSFKQIIQSEAAYLYDENGISLPIGLENSNWNIGYGVQGGDQDRKQNITVCYRGKGYMEYVFDVPSAGEYYWLIRFNSQVSNAVRQLDFSINDGEHQTITFPQKGKQWNTTNTYWEAQDTKYVFQFMKQCVSLKSGINSIKVYTPADYWSDTSSVLTIEMDYMAITSIDIPDISSGIDKEVISPAYLLENNLTSVSFGLAPGFLKNNYSTGNQVLSFIVNDSASKESHHAINLGNTRNILMDKPISKYRYLRIYYECKKATEGIVDINAFVYLNNSEEVRRIWGNIRQITSNGNSGYIDIDLMKGWFGGEGLDQTTVNEEVNFDGPLIGLILKPWYKQERKVDDYFNIQGLAFYTKDDYDDSVPSYFNGDVMVEIPKMGYRFNRVGTNLRVSVTRDPEAVGFSYDAFLRGSRLNDYIYIGAYKVCNINSRIRSLSDQDSIITNDTDPVASISFNDIRRLAEANNSMENKGYSIVTYHAYTLIACLSLLYNKSIDTSNGYGNTDVEDTMFQKSGTTNTLGLIYKRTEDISGYKFIGIENINSAISYNDVPLEGIRIGDDGYVYLATNKFLEQESWKPLDLYPYISEEDYAKSGWVKTVRGNNTFGFLGKEFDGEGVSSSTFYRALLNYDNGSISAGSLFAPAQSNHGLSCIGLVFYYYKEYSAAWYYNKHNFHLMYSKEE